MNLTPSKKSTWPRQAAVVVSESPNVHMLLRELLRSYSWTVMDSTPQVSRAMEIIREGLAYLLIIDDTAQIPATRHLRQLLTDPVSLCTPVMCFQMEAHKAEAAALTTLGRPVVVEKPLTPSKFVPGFVSLVRTWEKEPFLSLRRAVYQLLQGQEGSALHHFNQLSAQNALKPFCAQAIALKLRQTGKVREAEAVLLSALKTAPRELGTMLALADLYLHAAMPKLAMRLLNGARAVFGPSTAILPDYVQAALLIGRLDEAAGALYLLARDGFVEGETAQYLARILFAEGRESEAEKVLNANKAVFKRLQNSWTAAEQQPVAAAG